jgi:hypothetical protein
MTQQNLPAVRATERSGCAALWWYAVLCAVVFFFGFWGWGVPGLGGWGGWGWRHAQVPCNCAPDGVTAPTGAPTRGTTNVQPQSTP